MEPYWIAIIIALVIIFGNGQKLILNNVRKRKGIKNMLPKEMLTEFIGKACTITLYGAGFGINCKIISSEENWLKVKEKNGNLRLVNSDMITDIKLLPEKYQDKF